MNQLKLILLTIFTSISFISFSQTDSEIEQFDRINKLRTNPKSFIPEVKKILDNEIIPPQIIESIKETINYLENVEPVPSLVFSSEIYNIQKNTDYSDKITIDSFITPKDILTEPYIVEKNGIKIKIVKFATICKIYAEHTNNSPAENYTLRGNFDPLAWLLIDYGIEGKGHRNNIMNPKFKEVAIFENKEGIIEWVQNFR